jgi:thioesterase domain-containing protein
LNLMRVGFLEKLSYVWQMSNNLIRKRSQKKDLQVEGKVQDEPPEAAQNFQKAGSQARSSYVPQEYSGRITLFNAQHFRPLRRSVQKNFLPACLDCRLEWAKWAEDGVELKGIPGDHRTMLKEPHVQVLANQLKACLEKAIAVQKRADGEIG